MSPETRARIAPVFLATVVFAAYAPSLTGGFLGYDDDWLIRDSPVMADAHVDALVAIASDLGRDTRLVLGAEYLPVRDVVVWTSVRAVGLWAPGLRAILLGLYVLAALAWRAWFIRVLGKGVPSEVASLVFALHPLHAESVAWLAGYKDVLALLFVGLALVVHARDPSRATRALVLGLTAAACFSKSVAVVLPALLALHDRLVGRKTDRASVALSFAVAAAASLVHWTVGSTVGMVAPLAGASRFDALATMAPVAVRYGARLVGIEPASIVYDVPLRTLADPIGICALAALIGLCVWALVVLRRSATPVGARVTALAVLWFFTALLPVSQVIVPLQNRMADRYLLIALAGPAMLVGLAVARLSGTAARSGAAALLMLLLFGATLQRGLVLADPVTLFAQATERAPLSLVGPYQLGMLTRDEDPGTAELAFREALSRDGLVTPRGCRAADNLAILLARSARGEEAVALLEQAHTRCPDDPRVGHNLALLVEDRGDHERARALLLDVLSRTPRYQRAWRSYASLFGPPPGQPPPAARFDPGDRVL